MSKISKKTKMVILAIIVVLGLWVALMAVDAYRFIDSEFSLKAAQEHKPIITLSDEQTDDNARFTGLGYTVTAKSEDGEFIDEKTVSVLGLEIYNVKIVQ